MSLRTRLHTPKRGWFFSVIALLALTAQIAVAVAPLCENREKGMSAHVESSGGAKGHFTHDDATCAACQARSIAGASATAPAAPIAHYHAVAVAFASVDRTHSFDVHLHENSRAPPVVS